MGGSQHYVVDLRELDGTRVADAGGKGASLGELSRIDGVEGPSGFCLTPAAYRAAVAAVSSPDALTETPVPEDVAAAIAAALGESRAPGALRAADEPRVSGAPGEHAGDAGWAVRSSATAEDLP